LSELSIKSLHRKALIGQVVHDLTPCWPFSCRRSVSERAYQRDDSISPDTPAGSNYSSPSYCRRVSIARQKDRVNCLRWNANRPIALCPETASVVMTMGSVRSMALPIHVGWLRTNVVKIRLRTLTSKNTMSPTNQDCEVRISKWMSPTMNWRSRSLRWHVVFGKEVPQFYSK
jgi:hypothetical protein